MLPVDPNLEDNNEYRWDRPYYVAARQAGRVTAAGEHVAKSSGRTCLKVTVGFDGPEGGVAIDAYLTPPRGPYYDFLRAVAPEMVVPGAPPIDASALAALAGRRVVADVSEEWNENYQKNDVRLSNFRRYETQADQHAAPAAESAV